MLDLDSPDWSALEHAYGTAEDIPALLRHLESFPPDVAHDDGTWHMLWSSLCHQSDIYSASFAAVPHIVRLAAVSPDRISMSHLALPTSIEASRLSSATPVPAGLSEAYFRAIGSLPAIVAACFDREWDDIFARTASAALCAAKGHGGLADAILELSEDVLEEFNDWIAAEWQRKHPPIPPPPPSIQIQPPSSTSST